MSTRVFFWMLCICAVAGWLMGKWIIIGMTACVFILIVYYAYLFSVLGGDFLSHRVDVAGQSCIICLLGLIIGWIAGILIGAIS